MRKNRDFHVLNGFDHTLEAIGDRTSKIVTFHAKIVWIAQNHENSTPFSAIYPVLNFKSVFRIVNFRKILDGDPTKITKMSRKIDLLEVLAEKP